MQFVFAIEWSAAAVLVYNFNTHHPIIIVLWLGGTLSNIGLAIHFLAYGSILAHWSPTRMVIYCLLFVIISLLGFVLIFIFFIIYIFSLNARGLKTTLIDFDDWTGRNVKRHYAITSRVLEKKITIYSSSIRDANFIVNVWFILVESSNQSEIVTDVLVWNYEKTIPKRRRQEPSAKLVPCGHGYYRWNVVAPLWLMIIIVK